MKQLITKAFMLVLILACSVTISRSQTLTGEAAQKIAPGAESIILEKGTTIPIFIKFMAGSDIKADIWQVWLKDHFKMQAGLGFTFLNSETDQLGITHIRYQQTFNGRPIYGIQFLVHTSNGNILSMNGRIYDKINASLVSSISESQALGFALKTVGASVYKWQIPEEERLIKSETGREGASYYPKAELVMAPVGGNFSGNDYRLAYKFDVYAHQPMSRQYIFVDAQNGSILLTLNRIWTENKDVNANATGTAVTKYSGTRTFTTDYTGSTYRLRETGRGLGIETYNMQVGTNYGAAVDFTDADNTWNNVNTAQDEVASDAHWGTEVTYDYFSLNYGRNSIDNAGFKLISYVHANLVGMGYGNNINAFWDGTRMTYGDGGSGYSPLTTLDICGHEITHGLTSNTANLTYSNESGALNEGFSDIFGTAIEFYGKPPLQTGNWTMGENMGTPFRSMSNPNLYSQPDTYNGTNWYTGTNDNGGVHTNSGVVNYWFYLLCQGGSGTNDIGSVFNITGIGMTKAGAIAYRTLVYYLTSSSNYANCRAMSLQACTDLYGGCSNEMIQTTNAWYAVGVGTAYVPSTAHADFSACPTSSCANAPYSVQFANASTGGNHFKWYFGDGTTDTASTPLHTYTANGSYTVKLVADGGTCGKDSLTRTAYINIGPSYPCTNNMPATGTGTTITNCTGTLYDSGICGDYANNTSGTLTIAPTGATKVTLQFVSFNMEATYDFLYVYDGPTVASAQVAGSPFSGTTLPANITSTGSSLTLKQTSDAGVVASGFQINWNCVTPNSPPVVAFTLSNTTSCTGLISFTDQTSNNPVSWLWNFGDGTTSTLQSPTHLYTTNGTYSVKLKATNTFGSDSLIQTNVVTIAMPTGPTTTGASRCGTGTLSLGATGSGILKWYTAQTGGTLVNTGNSYTTLPISTTTTYYVSDSIAPPIDSVGRSSFAGAGTSTGTHYLIFDCFSACKLVSVKIYAQAGGSRTISLKDNTGAVLQTTTVTVPTGQSRVTLNWNLTPATGLRLEGINLYRQQTGGAYPYTMPGYISITGNDVGAAYYYYFYSWFIQKPSCVSARTPVVATINNGSEAGTSAALDTTMCAGNSTTLNVTGYSGTIQWQILNGSVWQNISGATSPSYTTPALTATTSYRAKVITGTCLPDSTNITVITILPAAEGGTAAATNPSICTGTSTTITLTGYAGTIQWQVLNGSVWQNINGASSPSYLTPTLTSTTSYRAWLVNGSCPVDSSSVATVTVSPVSVGGTATATNATICSGSNTVITLTGYTGTIQWQTNAGGTWQNISGATSATYTTPNLTATTGYRAVVKSGNCLSVNSTVSTVTVNPVSVGGTATAVTSVLCAGNGTVINLTGQTGTIQWQTNAGGSWQNISGANTATYITPTLTATTSYRAVVTSGVCTSANSTTATVTVNPLAIGGIATAVTPVCTGTSSTITLTAYAGSIQWQTDSSGSWQNIPGATSVTYNTPNLNSPVSYRAILTSGICSPDTSTIAMVTLGSSTMAGTATPYATAVCSGSGTSITLSGYSGNIQWQTNAGGTWQNISGEIYATYNTPGLTTPTSYQAVVSNPGCTSSVSNIITIAIHQPSTNPASISGYADICSGGMDVLNIQGGSLGDGASYEWGTGSTCGSGILNGAINSSLFTGPLSTTITYWARITGGTCAVTTPCVFFTVNVNQTPQANLTALTSTTICTGDSVTLQAGTGIGYNFMWLNNGTVMNGVNGNSYSAHGAGNYAVVIYNFCGTDTSTVISVTETTTALATLAPAGQVSLCAGDSVTLFANTGNGYTYEWLNDGNPIAGEISSSLTVSTPGNYSVIVTSNCGTATSPATLVNVWPAPAVPVITQSNDTLFSDIPTGNQWYLNGTLIPGATGAFYIAVANGDYYVINTDQNGCIADTSNLLNVTVTGIGEQAAAAGVSFFPNPSKGIVSYIINSKDGNTSVICLTDVTGRVVLSESISLHTGINYGNIDLSNFARGIYFIRIANNTNFTTQKLVLN
ncbi:MAG: M4 family metallopeptidase [Bacteroidota bacterium]